MKKGKITGIGGVFFKTDDPATTKAWYQKHLGLPVDDWGCTFWWQDHAGNKASTQWSPFPKNTAYFEPGKQEFMINYRVEHLEELLEDLRSQGVQVLDKRAEYEYGKFAWILDNNGTKIELWEPKDEAFL